METAVVLALIAMVCAGFTALWVALGKKDKAHQDCQEARRQDIEERLSHYKGIREDAPKEEE